ncbi:MAG: DUF4097 domain-containing protein [Gemmatimonadetes bacterium]|nr:DUF4097 domain-containing protein [Gemmatimonadota bacterium]
MMRAALLVPVVLAALACEASGQEQVNQTIPTVPTGQIEIVNVAGSVRVMGWDRNEIRITGRLGEGTERLAVEGGRDRTTIRVVLPQNRRNVRGSDLEIRVPSRKELTVRTTSATIELAGLTGGLTAQSTSGDVEITGNPRQVTAGSTSGNVQVNANTRIVSVNTTSGNIKIAGRAQESIAARSVSGDVELEASTPELTTETVSGDLRVRGVTRRVSANTVSGDVEIRGARIQYLSMESVSGDLHFNGELASDAALNIESHSGDVELALPGDVAVNFKLNSFSGDIESAFGPGPQRTSRHGPGQELTFSTGSRGIVAARTFSGSIRIQRR